MSAHEDLHAQLAQRLFGWTWRADIERWMTPDADPVLAQDLPAYSTDPAATAQVWQWVERQDTAGILEVSFEYLRSQRRVVCTLYYPESRGMIDEGASWPEALCRAALALADALAGEETR